jgi:two-component system NtrC family sensor kinase
MTIRNKLLLAMTIVLAFVAFLGFAYYRSLVSMRNRLQLVESIDDLTASVSDMRRAEKNYLLYHDITSAKDLTSQVSLTRQAIQDKSAELIALEGEGYFKRLNGHFSSYAGLATRLVASEGRAVDAERLREQGHLVYSQARGVVSAERERIEEMINEAHHAFLLSILIIILLGAIGAVLVGKDIVAPLTKIERATREVSVGKYVPIRDLKARDEIGKLARAFNHMVKQIETHQAELVQAGKLASLGTLTSGVAHELNNPLNNISMMAQTYIQLYDDLSPAERLKFMADVDAQCERAREIVHNLLDFSRWSSRGYALGDIGQVAAESLQLVRNQLNLANIEADLDIAPGLPPVHMNANAIKQVLINLFTNAIKAMPHGGRLSVEVGPTGEERVQVAIADTGVGIERAVLGRIFDPFFTTSNPGQGTGLGLSVSYSIAKRHGGTISVVSEPGEGSTFTLELPVNGKEIEDGQTSEAINS